MRIFERKKLNGFIVGIMLCAIPTMASAYDKSRTISKDELRNNYGTYNKNYNDKKDKRRVQKAPPRPLTQKIEKGSFAYSMGVDAAKSGDVKNAVKHWKSASQAGNFYAHWQLARFYLGVFKTQKNDKQAIKYLRLVVAEYDESSESRARRQLSADAMVELAIFYTIGSKPAGVKPQLPVALKLLKLASASVGHSKANFLLGELYFSNQYIRPQKKRAVRYFTLAARKNNFAAQIKLGQIYYLQGSNLKAKIRGLAWLLVARKNKPQNLQDYADKIIAQAKGKKLGAKQLELAESMAERLYQKWNF